MFIQNKEQIKQYTKAAFLRIIGILIPVVILLIYLILTGTISEFINYAVLGISTFSNKISYVELFQNEKIEIIILAILVPVTIISMAVILISTKMLKKENENIQKILTLLVYSFSIIMVMYPISDEIHFLIGSLISIIGLIYLICLLGKIIYKKINFNKKYKKYKIITLIIWTLIFSIISTRGIKNLYEYINVEKNTEIQHYKNIEIEENLKRRINKIDKYILKKEQEGKKVYILDAEAAIYMVPLNKYNKDYDMFLKGNIGKDGEEGQIQKIKQKDENTLYLVIRKDLICNWQTPLNVINYIRENLELVEEISIYEVYR